MNEVTGSDYNNLEDIEEDVSIIHYAGTYTKPWQYKKTALRKYWDKAYIEVYHKEYSDFMDVKHQAPCRLNIYYKVWKKLGFSIFMSQLLYDIQVFYDIYFKQKTR